jgi:hypothetical protein
MLPPPPARGRTNAAFPELERWHYGIGLEFAEDGRKTLGFVL